MPSKIITAVKLVSDDNSNIAIHEVRGEKVILDEDLARIYGVTTVRFNQAIKRNIQRFPLDFRFQCTTEEWNQIQSLRSQIVILKNNPEILRSQIAILKNTRGSHRKYLPHVFTEHGALMAANILRSPRAVEMSVFVIRAFIKMRGVLNVHKELGSKIAELERRMSGHDAQLRSLFEAIRQLMQPPAAPKREFGFRVNDSDKPKNAKRK